MQKAVKNLIKDRGLEKYNPNVVQVESKPSRPINHCHENSQEEVKLHRPYSGVPNPVKLVAGWIVSEWNGKYAGVIPHFWNFDTRTNTHYDTTDTGYFKNDPSANVTYVVDTTVGDLNWTNAMKGIAYKSDNRPRFVYKQGTIPMNNFSNQTIESLCKSLEAYV